VTPEDIDALLSFCPCCGDRAFAGWQSADKSRGGAYCVTCGYGVKPT